jgi:hypothetical protein
LDHGAHFDYARPRDVWALRGIELPKAPGSLRFRSYSQVIIIARIMPGNAMLDIDASIDQSFAGMHNAPRFMAVEIAQAGADGEAEFIRNMEQSYSTHIAELEAWISEGQARLKGMEQFLKATAFDLDPGQVARFIRLSEAISARAEQSAGAYAQTVKRLNKQSRAFAKYSKTASTYVASLAARIEVSLGREIEFLTDAADQYRGIARAHDPQNTRGPAFDNPDDLIAYLRAG